MGDGTPGHRTGDGDDGTGAGAGAAHDSARRERELAEALARVEERVERACAAAGRARREVTLIVVTKTHPAEDVRLLARLGVRDIAENRVQEALGKIPAGPLSADEPALRRHFVGQVQTNKARAVAGWADVVHSVDRPRLVGALDAAVNASERAEPLDCLIQVALDREGGSDLSDPVAAGGDRGGVAPERVAEVAGALDGAAGLRLAGVMAVAPLKGAYAGRPGAAFERLVEIARDLRSTRPAATMVSAGMSGDLEEAIAAGATHIRVGSAVLGVRRTLR
ncbi:YggS family pyridoxal phosphate-dependent enzyme [Streptomyces calidiresistens]|uniref:Pyridoxal phosphate homeostasis protein n=1 Tax=Streptomyces calidiresistens TaxID=1485586 RepID=A0A7W3XV14_9ACTN|nr:YggS family pyridoxal phosphate-dependent enzyme [Streptomyces calidiresistens]MBB0228262.1 YggS family pyridoxal phosphate-dependent enzyme [Streptomyces calidiresistens]